MNTQNHLKGDYGKKGANGHGSPKPIENKTILRIMGCLEGLDQVSLMKLKGAGILAGASFLGRSTGET